MQKTKTQVTWLLEVRPNNSLVSENVQGATFFFQPRKLPFIPVSPNGIHAAQRLLLGFGGSHQASRCQLQWFSMG